MSKNETAGQEKDQLEAIKKVLVLIAVQNGADSKLVADVLGVSEQWVRGVIPMRRVRKK